METKHTKVEWEYKSADYSYLVRTKETKFYIATIEGQSGESKTNARLIATAPELLEHLILLIDRMEENGLGHMSAVTRSIEIVERATGMKYERTPNFK